MNNKNIHDHIRNRRSSARTVSRTLPLLLLTLAIAAGSLHAARPARNVLNAFGTSATEGNSGITSAAVVVTLDSPHPGGKAVTVQYRTYDGSATAGSDYDAVSGTLTFAKGQTSKTIQVPIRGDRIGEWDRVRAYYGYGNRETFYVELFNPKNGGTLGYSYTAIVEIVDDEPQILAGGSSDYEGNDGTKPITFTLSLSAVADETVTVDFSTQDYTAFAGIDYVAKSGTITFAPGETSKTFTVDVIGNYLAEPDKYFYVNLDYDGVPSSVAVGETSIYGTIMDDDGYWDYYYYYYDYGYGYYDYGYYY
jgi:hypothetical protein